MPSSPATAVTFTLHGPLLLNLTCLGFYGLFSIPVGMLLVHMGMRMRRLSSRARRRGYDNRRIARAAARLGIRGELNRTRDVERLRNGGASIGMGYFALGALWMVIGSAGCFAIAFHEPHRLHVDGTTLALDYRWPRADRSISLDAITNLEYHSVLLRRRSHIDLRITLRPREVVKITAGGFGGARETIRAAGVAIGQRAGVELKETVVDKR